MERIRPGDTLNIYCYFNPSLVQNFMGFQGEVSVLRKIKIPNLAMTELPDPSSPMNGEDKLPLGGASGGLPRLVSPDRKIEYRVEYGRDLQSVHVRLRLERLGIRFCNKKEAHRLMELMKAETPEKPVTAEQVSAELERKSKKLGETDAQGGDVKNSPESGGYPPLTTTPAPVIQILRPKEMARQRQAAIIKKLAQDVSSAEEGLNDRTNREVLGDMFNAYVRCWLTKLEPGVQPPRMVLADEANPADPAEWAKDDKFRPAAAAAEDSAKEEEAAAAKGGGGPTTTTTSSTTTTASAVQFLQQEIQEKQALLPGVLLLPGADCVLPKPDLGADAEWGGPPRPYMIEGTKYTEIKQIPGGGAKLASAPVSADTATGGGDAAGGGASASSFVEEEMLGQGEREQAAEEDNNNNDNPFGIRDEDLDSLDDEDEDHHDHSPAPGSPGSGWDGVAGEEGRAGSSERSGAGTYYPPVAWGSSDGGSSSARASSAKAPMRARVVNDEGVSSTDSDSEISGLFGGWADFFVPFVGSLFGDGKVDADSASSHAWSCHRDNSCPALDPTSDLAGNPVFSAVGGTRIPFSSHGSAPAKINRRQESLLELQRGAAPPDTTQPGFTGLPPIDGKIEPEPLQPNQRGIPLDAKEIAKTRKAAAKNKQTDVRGTYLAYQFTNNAKKGYFAVGSDFQLKCSLGWWINPKSSIQAQLGPSGDGSQVTSPLIETLLHSYGRVVPPSDSDEDYGATVANDDPTWVYDATTCRLIRGHFPECFQMFSPCGAPGSVDVLSCIVP